jgi:hypothetical protein
LSQNGERLVHRQMKAAPAPFLKAMAPDRDGLVVAVEGLFTWDGLAALGAQEESPFVLGHARARKAMHGGTAKHATIDSPKMATRRRGGRLPKADVYPAARPATRDGLRRRTHRRRQRAALWAPVQHPKSPDTVPAIGTNIAYQATREGVAARFDDPAVHKTREVDLELIPSEAQRRSALARLLLQPATPHEAYPLS